MMPDRNGGNLPIITAVEVNPDNDRLIVWDDSATGIERTKAIIAEQLREFMLSGHLGAADPHPQYLTVDELPSSSTGGSFERTFTNTDLTIAGILPVTHSLNSYPSGVLIWNASGQLIEPTNIDILTLNAISIDLSEFAPLSGTWRTSITI